MKRKKNSSKLREFNVLIEKDVDGYFIGSVASLKGCHTQAKSLDQLMVRMTEVIELCLDEMKEEKIEIPLSNEFVGIQKIAL